MREEPYDRKEEMTKFGYTVTVYAKAEKDGFRTWISCPTCNAIVPYSVMPSCSNIDSAFGEVSMGGYMHARSHHRATPEYVR
jgi:hypothetical protein